MAFENIDCVQAKASTAPVPANGVRVVARKLERKDKGKVTRWIQVTIGPKLARSLTLSDEKHGLRVLFGKDNDAGKVRICVDNSTGKFQTKRLKNGGYSFSINEMTAEGLFALDFESFDRANLEAIRPENGTQPHCTFKASPAMLDIED